VLQELAAQFGASWWQEVILLLLALDDPSVFQPFMREVVKQPVFVTHGNFIDMCLDDAAEQSLQPFLELLDVEPGQDQDLWTRQFMALQLVARMDPEMVEDLLPALNKHPSPKIRQWLQEQSKQAQQTVISAERGGYELVFIPGGVFMMGSPETEEGRYDREGPLHEVQLSDFYMGRYPVTNEEYGRFLAANPEMEEPGSWGDRQFNQPNQPVVGMSWKDAQQYATWAGLRLPTEAEWEYACRAGTTTRYYTGDAEEDLDRAGWYRGNAGGT
ncbi:MAG: formylglycine-generating enzyme family protein, partial [Gammaproteobacteria bacterium]|nr:formylglycine-generating enzyme family protein [Gammaproteobacteria bacterium]